MKTTFKIRMMVLAMALMILIPLCASAKSRGREELITLNLDEAETPAFQENSYFQARWIQVLATIEGTHDVTVHVVLDEDHTPNAQDKVVYKRTTKKVTGQYKSPEIFLDFRGSKIEPYRIDLIIDGEVVKSAEIHRMLLNLNGNTVCLRGIRFRDIDSGKTDKWFTFHPINLAHASDGTVLDLVGSNMYLIGQMVIHRDGDNIMFEIVNYDQMNASVEGDDYEQDDHMHDRTIIDHAFDFSDMRIGIYHKFSDIQNVARSAISKRVLPGQWYNIHKIGANGNVILYLNGRVSYNPNGLPRVNAVQSKDHLTKLLESFAY